VCKLAALTLAILFLTPVTFGGYSSWLKKAVDRQLGHINPTFLRNKGDFIRAPRYDKYPSLVGIGVLPAADLEAEYLFTSLLGRNAANLHSPSHAAGVVTRNQDRQTLTVALETLIGDVEVSHG